jgi:hypothetical protein
MDYFLIIGVVAFLIGSAVTFAALGTQVTVLYCPKGTPRFLIVSKATSVKKKTIIGGTVVIHSGEDVVAIDKMEPESRGSL